MSLRNLLAWVWPTAQALRLVRIHMKLRRSAVPVEDELGNAAEKGSRT
jgi:hypothetical protein